MQTIATCSVTVHVGSLQASCRPCSAWQHVYRYSQTGWRWRAHEDDAVFLSQGTSFWGVSDGASLLPKQTCGPHRGLMMCSLYYMQPSVRRRHVMSEG